MSVEIISCEAMFCGLGFKYNCRLCVLIINTIILCGAMKCLLNFFSWVSFWMWQVYGGKGEQTQRQIHLGGSAHQVEKHEALSFLPAPVYFSALEKQKRKNKHKWMRHILYNWTSHILVKLYKFSANSFFFCCICSKFVLAICRYCQKSNM